MAGTSTVGEPSGLPTNIPPTTNSSTVSAISPDPTDPAPSTTGRGALRQPTLIADAGVISGPTAGLSLIAAGILIAAYVAWVTAPQEDRDAIVGGAVDRIIGAAESINARFLVPARDQLMRQVSSLFENLERAGTSIADAERAVKNWVNNLLSGRTSSSTPVPMTPARGVPLPSPQNISPQYTPPASAVTSGGATGIIPESGAVPGAVPQSITAPTVDPAVQTAQNSFGQALADARAANGQVNTLRASPAGSDGQLQRGTAQFYWDIAGGNAGLTQAHATLRTLETRIAEARQVYADANAPVSDLKAAYARLTGAFTSAGGYGLASEATDSWMNVGRWSNDANWWRTQLNQAINAFAGWLPGAWQYVSDATHRPQQASLPMPPLGANQAVYEAWQAAMSFLQQRPAQDAVPVTPASQTSTPAARPTAELVTSFSPSVQSVADVWVHPQTGAVSATEMPASEGWTHAQIGSEQPPPLPGDAPGARGRGINIGPINIQVNIGTGGPNNNNNNNNNGNKILLAITTALGAGSLALSWRALTVSEQAGRQAVDNSNRALDLTRQSTAEPSIWLNPLPATALPPNASYVDKANAYIAGWQHYLDPQIDPRSNAPRGATHQGLLGLAPEVGVTAEHRAQFTQSATTFLAELNQTAARLRASRDPAEQKALFESLLAARPPVGRFGADTPQPQRALDATLSQMNTAMQNRATQIVNWPGQGERDPQLQRTAGSISLPLPIATAATPGQPQPPSSTSSTSTAQAQAQKLAQEAAAFASRTRAGFTTQATAISNALQAAVMPNSGFAKDLTALSGQQNALPMLPPGGLSIEDMVTPEQMNDPAALRAASDRLNTLMVDLRVPVSALDSLRADAHGQATSGRFSNSEALRSLVDGMIRYNDDLRALRDSIRSTNTQLLERATQLEQAPRQPEPAASPQ